MSADEQTTVMQTGGRNPGDVPSCTVIVCTHERVAELAVCLASLRAVRYPELEVHVVENGGHAGAENVARRFNARYSFLARAGLSRARNFGAQMARTDLVAFMDDDAVADPDWLASAAPEFSDPQVGVVTGPVLSIAGEPPWRSLGESRFCVDRTTPDWFARANFGGVGHGGNLVMRRALFNAWNGFDERLGRGAPLSGGEESFALFQLIDQGWRAVYVPGARVLHEDARGEALRDEARQTARDSFAYLLFLFAAAPAYRRDLLRYMAQALRRTRRDWRHHASPHRLNALESMAARFQAVPLFWRTWFLAR